ncbi:MAG: hypothetical protein J6B72_02285 [Clostridia bacterium]|nr:hypothetical protein [Clostridia bacterium]
MNGVVYLSSFDPNRDGKTNDYMAFKRCFEEVAKNEGGVVVIDAGKYLIDSVDAIMLCSNTTVYADNAEFFFPKDLGNDHHRHMFDGINVSNLTWIGGCFNGYVYDPVSLKNTWEPHACTKGIWIERTVEGEVSNIRFERVKGCDLAGSVISVYGAYDEMRDIRYPARAIDVHGCTFDNSGKFMWDYGYLWQRIVFPEYHTNEEIDNSFKYMPPELISGTVEFKNGSKNIYVHNMPSPIANEDNTICFFGNVPSNIKRGNCYYIRNCQPQDEGAVITVSETPFGEPMVISGCRSGECRAFRNLFTVHHNLYAPNGCGTGKGPLDLSVCDSVKVSDCRMSASGDSMHIHRSHNVSYTGNHITGSRMGAFFIAQFCKNVTVASNTVLGTNGSRVMSVEKSTEDITIVGNTFMGGGRGTWINQPYNIIISDNIFCENTNKCTPSPKIGRLTPNSGSYEYYPEIYLTTWEKDAKYGDVIMRSNIIKTTPYCSAAVAFHNGGQNIIFESNIIQGEKRDIYVGKKCKYPQFTGNIGMGNIIDEISEEKFDQ